MSKKTRIALAAVAAGAITLTMAPQAFAALDHADDAFTPEVVDPGLHRIAANDRIGTAIEASQSRSWGTERVIRAGRNHWECTAPALTDWVGQYLHGLVQGTETPRGVEVGETQVVEYRDVFGNRRSFTCTAVETRADVVRRDVDIIIARSDDYADAIAATPLADVRNAPVLINPTNELLPAVRNEIARLAGTAQNRGRVTVHILGGTNAISHDVENAIDDVLGNTRSTLRYQGIDRYQTAVTIASVTLNVFGIDSGADTRDANVYLTTGQNFPDALSAGAAAANNDGIVLLTAGEELDRRGFTEDFIIEMNTWINEGRWNFNTPETIAVGGPSARAAEAYDIRLAKSYVGPTRYETATLTARGEFDLIGEDDGVATQNYAVVSGLTYADSLVASSYIANADGPLLLTPPTYLYGATADYLLEAVDSNDRVFTFGGNGAMSKSVHDEIEDLLNF